MFSFFKSKSESAKPSQAFFFDNERDIHNWLKELRIKNYHITQEKEVNVEGDVHIFDKKIAFLPVQFNIVKGNFFCARNELMILQGSPRKVYGDFNVSQNKLVSLKHCPKKVKGYFDIKQNLLTSLDYFPYEVGALEANNNFITSIEAMANTEFTHKECVYIFLQNNPLTLESLLPLYHVVENNRLKRLKISTDVLNENMDQYVVDYDKKFALIKDLLLPLIEKEKLSWQIKTDNHQSKKLKI